MLATLAALMQFQEWGGVLWVWLVFGLGQVIEGNFITPKLVDKVKTASVYREQRFSDHAPQIMEYDIEITV